MSPICSERNVTAIVESSTRWSCSFCGSTADPTCVDCGAQVELAESAALVAPREPLAHQFFAMCQLENELDDAIVKAFGAEPDETETWPFGHIVYDWYDSSFEVWHTRNDFEATDDHLRAVFALGFAHGWICFKDGTEIFVDKKLKRNARRTSTVPRDSEDKYREAKSAALVAGLRQELARAHAEIERLKEALDH